MRSLHDIQVQLTRLDRLRQVYAQEIIDHTHGGNLVAALFSSSLRRQSLQTIAHAKHALAEINQEIIDLQEQQIVDLFLECWQEELENLPSALFLTPSTH